MSSRKEIIIDRASDELEEGEKIDTNALAERPLENASASAA